jgi:hypothetical protein
MSTISPIFSSQMRVRAHQCLYIYIYIYICVCVCVCVCVRARACACVRACMHTYRGSAIELPYFFKLQLRLTEARNSSRKSWGWQCKDHRISSNDSSGWCAHEIIPRTFQSFSFLVVKMRHVRNGTKDACTRKIQPVVVL